MEDFRLKRLNEEKETLMISRRRKKEKGV